mmetsp:Transcript_96296/g.294532  ORF Transcript_96296/g.294532 Transcript_96296/m.294532 type:complete len:201 (-) Transcript_96296:1408-2010(-)
MFVLVNEEPRPVAVDDKSVAFEIADTAWDALLERPGLAFAFENESRSRAERMTMAVREALRMRAEVTALQTAPEEDARIHSDRPLQPREIRQFQLLHPWHPSLEEYALLLDQALRDLDHFLRGAHSALCLELQMRVPFDDACPTEEEHQAQRHSVEHSEALVNVVVRHIVKHSLRLQQRGDGSRALTEALQIGLHDEPAA